MVIEISLISKSLEPPPSHVSVHNLICGLKDGNEKTGGTFQMAEILRKDVLTVGGIQSQFIGVRLGEFILRPDSDSEMRSEDLRVTRRETVLSVQGGSAPLRVRTQEGFSYTAFQSRLSQEDKIILRKLASDLAGWIWPDIGEVLRQRVEELGEDNVLRALRSLCRGVEETMKRINLYNRIPFIGRRLVLSIE